MKNKDEFDDIDILDIDDFDEEPVKKNPERKKQSGKTKQSAKTKESANPKEKQKKSKKKIDPKKKKILTCVLIAVAVLAVIFIISAARNVSYLKGRANELKTELATTFECIRNSDQGGAETAMGNVRDISGDITQNLNRPFWKFMSIVPVVSGDISSVKELMSILDDADESVITPLIALSVEYPFSALKNEAGINTNIVSAYIDFADSITPQLKDYAERMQNVDFKLIKMKSFDEYKEKFAGLSEGLDNIEDFKGLLNVIIGDGEDRTFLIMAQNTSEIRSCGGYPGACGFATIKDGMLNVEDFGPVADYIAYRSSDETGKTEEEGEIFGDYYMWQDHDACYNPHFPKVAWISKVACERETGVDVDGVISLTPAVIQDILAITGETLTLNDGTIVNGENASMTLQHDLYYKYYSADEAFMANDELVNELFAQTATLALDSLTGNMSFETIVKFVGMFRDGFDDRTIMIWSNNEEDENFLKSIGASGSLNDDANNPETGIFFSNSDASKTGMFVDINYTMGEAVKNANGQLEYPMKVEFTNTATEADLNISTYVKGSEEGTVMACVFLFAPMGGTISNVVYDNGIESYYANLYGLDLAYVQYVRIPPSTTLTVTYTVTTAPGVTTPLKVITTPTLQEYR